MMYWKARLAPPLAAVRTVQITPPTILGGAHANYLVMVVNTLTQN